MRVGVPGLKAIEPPTMVVVSATALPPWESAVIFSEIGTTTGGGVTGGVTGGGGAIAIHCA